MSPPETIGLPVDLFTRLVETHRRRGTDTWRHDATGSRGVAHRELFDADAAGHTRLTPKSAYLAAQYVCRIDEATDDWPEQEEADFHAICDLIPPDDLARIHAEDETERLALLAECRAERADQTITEQRTNP